MKTRHRSTLVKGQVVQVVDRTGTTEISGEGGLFVQESRLPVTDGSSFDPRFWIGGRG